MKVKFGKYKGQELTEVPSDYALWLKHQGNNKFYSAWRKAIDKLNIKARFDSKDPEKLSYKNKLQDGNYCLAVRWSISSRAARRGISNIIFYLVDADGHYIKDLKVIGDSNASQGAIDIEAFKDGWVTCSPTGRMYKGKMLVRPYEQEGFNYSTYQLRKEQLEFSRIPIK